MTWTKLDDGIFDHPKMLRAGEDAANLYVRALVYCNKHLTDGRIFPEVLATLTRRRDVAVLAQRLVDVAAWESHPDGGWIVHDFHAHNPTAEEVNARRAEISRKRAEAGKRGGIASAAARSNEANPKQGASKPEATPKQPGEANGKPRPVPSRPSVEDACASSVGDDAPASAADPTTDDRVSAIEGMIRDSSGLSRGVRDAHAEAAVIVSRHGDRTDLLDLVGRARDYLAGSPKRLPANGAEFLGSFIAKSRKPKIERPDAPEPEAGSPAARILEAIMASQRLRDITANPNEIARGAVKAYPAVDVPAEIARADAWLTANPANAKSNGARFLGNWLQRAQEKAPRVGGSGPALAPVATREEIAERLPVTPNRIIKGGLFGGR